LIAELIIRASEHKIRWDLFRELDGSLAIKVPILVGSKPEMWWDRLGGAITEGRAILRGKKDTDYLERNVLGVAETAAFVGSISLYFY